MIMKAKYMDMAAEALIFTTVTTGIKAVEGTVMYVIAADVPGRTVEKIKDNHQKRVEKHALKKEERRVKKIEREEKAKALLEAKKAEKEEAKKAKAKKAKK